VHDVFDIGVNMILRPILNSILQPILTPIYGYDYDGYYYQHAILDENLGALRDLLGNVIEEEY
jgi:hypothetical protein